MTTLSKGITAVALSAMMIVPMTADAQSHRQKTKNDWRNLAFASGGAGALGFLTHNSTIGWLGLGGAAYSAWRYEKDRKSQAANSRRYSSRYHLRRKHN